tara:strand:- start:401 stop:853 length:453 start_codon:yes stop_codon:yes gene_type:complete
MKKVLILSLIVIFCSFLAADLVQAQSREGCPVGGLVPCEAPHCPCRLCDFFVMIERIVNFFLFKLVPALAVLMIVIAGFMYIVAYMGGAVGGDSKKGPALLARAKQVLTSVVFGLFIVYGAWLLINLFFQIIGVSDWTGLQHGWWRINCG